MSSPKLVLASLLLVAPLLACKGPSDEDQIKAVIHKAIDAANDKKPGRVVDDALPDFKGPGGADLASCRQIITAYLIAPGWVHVFEQDLSVKLIDAENASARLDAVLAQGNPVKKLEDLVPTNGEALVFELTLRKVDGKWKLASATHRRALIAP